MTLSWRYYPVRMPGRRCAFCGDPLPVGVRAWWCNEIRRAECQACREEADRADAWRLAHGMVAIDE